jgi:hypothetical protein
MAGTTVTVNGRKITMWDGYNLAAGICTFFVVCFLIGYVVDHLWPRAYDDSDNAPTRSGVRIVNDHLTGCQYFQTWLGGITPRMDRDGKQVCSGSKD